MTRHRRRFSRRNILFVVGASVILATVAIAAFGLLPGTAAFIRSPPRPATASRLSRGEVTRLLGAAGNAGLTFEPYQGRRRCCDLGDPTLHLYADGRAVVAANGFVVDERVGRISIADDGRLEWLSEDSSLAQWLRTKDLQAADFYRQGQSLYLVKAGSSFPELPLRHLDQWPFKIASDSLRPTGLAD